MYDSQTMSYYYVSSFHCGVGVGMVRVIYGKKRIRMRLGDFAEVHTKLPVSFIIRLLHPSLGFKSTQR